MSYITENDIEARVSEAELILITTDDVSASVPDSSRISEAIEDAEGIADGYIGKRYSVPLSDVPLSVKRACVSIAVYYLYRDRSTPRDDEAVSKNYDEALSFLRDVSTGKAVLIGASSNAELSSPGTYGSGYWNNPTRRFTRDKLSGF